MWSFISNITLNNDNQPEYASYETVNPNEIMISYGRKNDTQSYGGGVVIINRYENKPCFLPIYENDAFKAVVYIFNDTHQNRIVGRISKSDIIDYTVLFRIFYR